MLTVILKIIFTALLILVGGFDIWMVIENFNEQKYFSCGTWLMSAVVAATILVKAIW
jgi:hypothetical protein